MLNSRLGKYLCFSSTLQHLKKSWLHPPLLVAWKTPKPENIPISTPGQVDSQGPWKLGPKYCAADNLIFQWRSLAHFWSKGWQRFGDFLQLESVHGRNQWISSHRLFGCYEKNTRWRVIVKKSQIFCCSDLYSQRHNSKAHDNSLHISKMSIVWAIHCNFFDLWNFLDVPIFSAGEIFKLAGVWISLPIRATHL